MRLFHFAAAIGAAALSAAAPAAQASDSSLDALKAEIAAIESRLPLVQGPITVAGIELRGREIVYDMRLKGDLTDEAYRAFTKKLAETACGHPVMSAAIADGVSFTYTVLDETGETVTASVDSCG